MASSISDQPPSTRMLLPVMNAAPADARNTITAACRVQPKPAVSACGYVTAAVQCCGIDIAEARLCMWPGGADTERKRVQCKHTGRGALYVMHGGSTAGRAHLLVGAADALERVQRAGRCDNLVLRLLQQEESSTYSETSSQRSAGCRLGTRAPTSCSRQPGLATPACAQPSSMQQQGWRRRCDMQGQGKVTPAAELTSSWSPRS